MYQPISFQANEQHDVLSLVNSSRNYEFTMGIWTNDTDYSPTKKHLTIKGMKFFQSKGYCADNVENKYFVGQFKQKIVSFGRSQNTEIMCDFLLSILSNNIHSIAVIGDSVSIPNFNGMVRDIFEFDSYECNSTLIINNISISGYNEVYYEIVNIINYDEYKIMRNEICVWPDKCANIQNQTEMRICQCVPRVDVNVSFIYNTNYYSFILSHIHSYSIFPNLNKYNTIKKIRSEAYSMGYTLFTDVTKEFDSIIVNIGLHYDSMTTYHQSVRFIFDTLAQDMEQTNRKKHIYRHSYPQHFTDKNKETKIQFGDYQFGIQKCLKFNEITQIHLTHVISAHIQQFYPNVYTIDYYQVLKTRGDAHIWNGRECTHWCVSHKLWKPFLYLLSKIYSHKQM